MSNRVMNTTQPESKPEDKPVPPVEVIKAILKIQPPLTQKTYLRSLR